MESKEQSRAPRITGTNVVGDWKDIDYSKDLLTIVLFFDPVSINSQEAVEGSQHLADRYKRLPIGFWYVMVPRLSCMFKGNIAHRTQERFCLTDNFIFDGNGILELQTRVKVIPTLLIVDSNSFIRSQYEGEISFREVERTIQARLSVSGYRDELPGIGEMESDLGHSRDFAMKQLGYVTGDYLFSSLVTPETDQQFSHPDFYLPNTVYPCGSWFVGRDFIEGKPGSTVYVSCLKDESVFAFLGSENGAVARVHTSMESTEHLALGRDVRRSGTVLELKVSEFRPYEVLSFTGDSDVLVSLQIVSGSLKLYCVEYYHHDQVVQSHLSL